MTHESKQCWESRSWQVNTYILENPYKLHQASQQISVCCYVWITLSPLMGASSEHPPPPQSLGTLCQKAKGREDERRVMWLASGLVKIYWFPRKLGLFPSHAHKVQSTERKWQAGKSDTLPTEGQGTVVAWDSIWTGKSAWRLKTTQTANWDFQTKWLVIIVCYMHQDLFNKSKFKQTTLR